MGYGDYIRDLLRPLGVYDFTPGGYSHSETEALGVGFDGCAEAVDYAEQEGILMTAEGEGLPLQFEVMAGTTGTDADEIAVSGCGVRTVLFSIPQRYMHTPVEVIDPADVEAAAALIVAFCRALADRYEKEGAVC